MESKLTLGTIDLLCGKSRTPVIGGKYQCRDEKSVRLTEGHTDGKCTLQMQRESEEGWMYRIGKDNSGGVYEWLGMYSKYHEWEEKFERVVLQTWNRKELFVDMWTYARPYPRAEMRMMGLSSIVKLDEISARKLVALLDSAKETKNV